MQCKKCGSYFTEMNIAEGKCPRCGMKIQVKESLTDKFPVFKIALRLLTLGIVIVVLYLLWNYESTPSDQQSTSSQNTQNVVIQMEDGRDSDPGGSRHQEAVNNSTNATP